MTPKCTFGDFRFREAMLVFFPYETDISCCARQIFIENYDITKINLIIYKRQGMQNWSETL